MDDRQEKTATQELFSFFIRKVLRNEETISMLLGALVVIIVGILIYNYFRSMP